jgi:hypothetical protein
MAGEVAAVASIRHEVEIDATAEQVWDAVRDVGAVHRRLVPGLAVGARMDGDVRIVSLPDSSVVRELILDVDDETRRLAYAVVEGRMALVYHHAALEVFAEGPGRSRLVWITDFLPDDMAAEIRLRTERGIQVMKRALERKQCLSPPEQSYGRPGGRAVRVRNASADR